MSARPYPEHCGCQLGQNWAVDSPVRQSSFSTSRSRSAGLRWYWCTEQCGMTHLSCSSSPKGQRWQRILEIYFGYMNYTIEVGFLTAESWVEAPLIYLTSARVKQHWDIKYYSAHPCSNTFGTVCICQRVTRLLKSYRGRANMGYHDRSAVSAQGVLLFKKRMININTHTKNI